MLNFEYVAPTRVVFGRGAEAQIGALVRAQDCRKALIHFGGGSAERSGLLARIRKSLAEAGVAFVELGGVVPNPRLSKVNEGVALCREAGVDFLLAVGGGSVIDSAKAIGYGLANDCDVWDLFSGRRKPSACVPVGAVLTIAAAGSEMSDSCVLTNEDGWFKRGLHSDAGRCRFAVMNPELTVTLPDFQTACGCTDILMHTMERYFTTAQTSELTDAMAEALLKVVLENARILKADPANYDARAEIMWAGSLSHNGLTGLGGVGDWATHGIEHELGGLFDVAHGAGLAAVWGSWARYVLDAKPARFARFARNVLGISGEDERETALRGIAAMEDFYREIGMPTNLRELGLDLSDRQLEELVDKCTAGGSKTTGNFKKLGREDVLAVYRAANA